MIVDQLRNHTLVLDPAHTCNAYRIILSRNFSLSRVDSDISKSSFHKR
jgi:hypothetical protein